MSKNYLIAFASPDLSRSAKRFYEQANNLGYFDGIKVFSLNDLKSKQRKKLIHLIKVKKKIRGYGYWFWKPMIIKNFLEKINKNDTVAYVDVGCHLNKNGIDVLKNYYKKLKNSKKGLIAFQYKPLSNYKPSIYDYPIPTDLCYSKADLLNYLGVLHNKSIVNSQQYWSGFFILRKNKFTIKFINQWLNIFEKRYDLIDDSPSKINNHSSFVQNQHDQSVFSILCKIYKIKSLSAYECEWFYFKGKRFWEHTKNKPIIAKRDKKYNFLRRFINRQNRTFRRYRLKTLKFFF